jgi:hypothetical protein
MASKKRKKKLVYINVYDLAGNVIDKFSGKTIEEARKKANKFWSGRGPFVV